MLTPCRSALLLVLFATSCRSSSGTPATCANLPDTGIAASDAADVPSCLEDCETYTLFKPLNVETSFEKPWLLTSGDFDGDSTPDLATTAFEGQAVDVLLTRNEPQFHFDIRTTRYPITPCPSGTGFFPRAIFSEDADGDGCTDLIAIGGRQPYMVMTLRGDCAGGLEYFRCDEINEPKFATMRPAIDFDGNGMRDIVGLGDDDPMGHDYGGTVFLRERDTPLRRERRLSTFGGPWLETVFDADADGEKDLLLAGWSSSATIYFNNSGRQEAVFLGGTPVSYVAAGDVNGDGFVDVASLHFEKPHVGTEGSVAFGKGDGTYSEPVLFETSFEGRALAAIDVEGTGKSALLASEGGSELELFSEREGQIALLGAIGSPFNVRSMWVGDLNGDGRDDLAGVSEEKVVFGLLSRSCKELAHERAAAFARAPSLERDTTVEFSDFPIQALWSAPRECDSVVPNGNVYLGPQKFLRLNLSKPAQTLEVTTDFEETTDGALVLYTAGGCVVDSCLPAAVGWVTGGTKLVSRDIAAGEYYVAVTRLDDCEPVNVKIRWSAQ